MNPHAKGRWYRFFIESDGATAKITQSDLEGVEIANNALKLPEGFHVIDAKFDITAATGGSTSALAIALRRWNDGRQGLNLPAVATYTSAYVYIFSYKAE